MNAHPFCILIESQSPESPTGKALAEAKRSIGEARILRAKTLLEMNALMSGQSTRQISTSASASKNTWRREQLRSVLKNLLKWARRVDIDFNKCLEDAREEDAADHPHLIPDAPLVYDPAAII